ncbi:hypothetical protein K474DRAFT_1663839 [Panus rudis PR-1116 ss-1]|nr:hypothetical protein K474DRAFT_1663839 [Panus rudis PR-1116 ss-1]
MVAATAADLLDPKSPAYKKAKRNYLKTTRNRPEHIHEEWTPFRAAEKKYKARFPPPDLSEVLDLAAADESRAEEVKRGGWTGRPDAFEWRELPLTQEDPKGKKKAYVFPDIPGLVLLPSFLSHEEQRRLVRWSLREHSRHPNETNLDTHYILPSEGLWNAYLNSRQVGEPEHIVPPRATYLDPSTVATKETSGPRQLVSNEPASKSNLATLSSDPKLPAPPSLTVKPLPPSSLISKLRWANIGWYYHWGTKQYDFKRGKIEVDEHLKEVCRTAVNLVPWQEVFGPEGSEGWDIDEDWRTWGESYEPDAGIVNFYQTKDTLMAHVDRSEVCTTTPLVSISLGSAAIFLIGGLTRDTPPKAILLRSGDVVIMSGPQCRRAYHGVPRILEGTLPPHFVSENDGVDEKGGKDLEWEPYEEYLRTTRINVNVRQVFPKGFTPPL